MFVDRVKIHVLGGKGGDGCVSFRREKYVPRGGPDGGDGGRGGSVILRASDGEQNLVSLRFKQHWEGRRGGNGRGKGCYGASGADVIIRVPAGTVIREKDTGDILGDLTQDGQEYVAAQGGKGGLGNVHFVTSQRRAPRIATPGTEGQQAHLELELKTIADVGLVGYPNAGKSTLIAAISDAHPKTAPYPFTTLYPVVGVVQFPDFMRYTVADIPGLIEGAHENVGLGHEFLRHIERCRVLVYVLDTAGVDDRLPWVDLTALRQELELHQAGLSSRPGIVVANKMDLDGADENLTRLRAETGLRVFAISALKHERTEQLTQTLRELLEAPAASLAAPPPDQALA